MKTFSSVVIATLTMVGMASAQPKVDAKAGAKVDAKAPAAGAKVDAKAGAAVTPPPAIPMPTPAPEVKEMLKLSAGTWKCTGSAAANEATQSPMKATMKTKADLDGFWIQDTFEGTMGKMKFKFVAYTTFDAASKKWRRVSVDSQGAQMIGTSDGVKDGKMTFNMDTMGGMGSGTMFKDSVDMTDPKLVKAAGTMSMDKGKTWMPVYEMSCKK
ncbi:MAG: hypothetical protein JWP01_1527 [Myxococcales bacterium]|nr:hypothetical protein [Myxococcales bacterium]